jgi:hypothetical protein
MNARRGISLLVAIALFRASAPVAADTHLGTRINLRELLTDRRASNDIVTMEIGSGDAVTGRVGRTQPMLFYVLDGTTPAGRPIPYTEVRALTDSTTGERFEAQIQGPIGGVGHASWKVWVIAFAVAIGALVIWVYASGFNRA